MLRRNVGHRWYARRHTHVRRLQVRRLEHFLHNVGVFGETSRADVLKESFAARIAHDVLRDNLLPRFEQCLILLCLIFTILLRLQLIGHQLRPFLFGPNCKELACPFLSVLLVELDLALGVRLVPSLDSPFLRNDCLWNLKIEAKRHTFQVALLLGTIERWVLLFLSRILSLQSCLLELWLV